MNETTNNYHGLTMAECSDLREQLARRYWQTMDYLASITVDRATLDDEIASRYE